MKSLSFFALLLLFGLFSAWTFADNNHLPDNKVPAELAGEWYAVNRQNEKGMITVKYKSDTYPVTFSDGVVRVGLSVNNCSADCKYKKGEILFGEGQGMVCTEACCDSEASLTLAMFMGEMSYYIDNGLLTVYTEWGNKMVLKRKGGVSSQADDEMASETVPADLSGTWFPTHKTDNKGKTTKKYPAKKKLSY